jgi:3-oxoacyl-[acyl-carrier protein] reductase
MKRIVFITGSTRGIGRATAVTFSKQNNIVILNGTKKSKQSEDLLMHVRQKSPQSDIFYFDVSKKKEVQMACKKILRKYKRIDVLINNAGILVDRTFIKMTYKEWDRVIKTNLYGSFFVTKEIIPSMINNGWGRIINISSIVGQTGNFGQTNYTAAKAGLIGFTKSLAKELAKYKITVNVVCPGFVQTDILKQVPKEYIKQIVEKIPLKRLGQPQEIANMLVFLASEKASYITGSIFNIDGGIV